ncbi:hypothetical protein PAMP_006924 [Pampus punctatissimus]
MPSTFWLSRHAALMLLIINWKNVMHCYELSVDPPEDLAILDPGHLGHLKITWSPPTSLINRAECPKLYQLEYFNTYKNNWTTIRTVHKTYTAQFDLTKDVRVRVYTLLNGPCTNGTLVKSKSYTELVKKPPNTGFVGTTVKNVICVFHNMEYMKCTWGKSPRKLANPQQTLYFWHKEMGQTEECPKYSISKGLRTGCDFTGKTLPYFTDINICVNGSSPEGPLEPLYISLQIQNQVQPEATDKLYLQTGPDAQLELHWESPVGRIPRHCLEWQVEHNHEGPAGNMSSQQITAKQTSLKLPSFHKNERNCFRVRSRMHKYCAQRSFWSDWSHETCHPVTAVQTFSGQREG